MSAKCESFQIAKLSIKVFKKITSKNLKSNMNNKTFWLFMQLRKNSFFVYLKQVRVISTKMTSKTLALMVN